MRRVLARAVIVAAVCAAVAGPAAYGGAKTPLSPLASVDVVGSGPLAWGSVAVRSKPDRSARVITSLTQIREHFRPRVVLALETRRDAAGKSYRGSRKFELYVGGKFRRTGPVAIGAPGMETPIGLFYVQTAFVPSQYPILGAYAFETSGYSKLSDWPGGGVVGVHGTNMPWLIGQAVSHRCVRLRNSDILALRRYVRLGTPVKVVRA